MESIKYPKSLDDIDLDKSYWSFWQGSYAYDIDKCLVCLYKVDYRIINRETGCIAEDVQDCDDFFEIFHGSFSLYRRFKIFNGRFGIDKGRPLEVITIDSNSSTCGFYRSFEDGLDKQALNDFTKIGIFQCLYNHLSKDLIKKP
jgi:hypothetical protein